MMIGQIYISVVGIIVLMAGAVIVGITIHFFIISRRSLNASIDETPGGKISKELSDWKLRYFNDIEQREKEIKDLKTRLTEAEDNYDIYAIEAEETRKQNKQLQSEIEMLQNKIPSGEQQSYMEQLLQAQNSLLGYIEKINQLLKKIDFEKETASRQRVVSETDVKISTLSNELKSILAQKEKEFIAIRQHEYLTPENRSMLDGVLEEFKALQGRIQNLEGHGMVARTAKPGSGDIQEGYFGISRDLEEQKLKNNVLATENRQLMADLSEIEAKLMEANFRQQQMQKKLVSLEELHKVQQGGRDASKNG